MPCPDFRRSHPTRRTLLKLGAVGLSGLTLPALLRAERERIVRKPRAKSVILLFQFGGASHIDTFDPKPDAPAEVRGEFKTIPTKTPGTLVTEHLPKLAARTDKFAVVRSVRHTKGAHNSGAYYSLTGREPLTDIVTANASATDFPHPGSVVDALTPDRGKVPASVALPWMIADGPFRTPGEFAGFLGKAHDPLWALGDPNRPDFKVTELTLPAGVGVNRVEDREAIREDLAKLSRFADGAAAKGMSEYQARAADLLTSPETQKAFAIQEEPAALRAKYGRNTYGQSVLLARRLVEAGVRFVTVYYSRGIGGWDTHKDNFRTLKESRLPHTDAALSALIDDLSERGLLDETLVYWTGDFGRTPKINKDAGRDHWPPCQSVVLFGGGVRGGAVYGASDPTGAYPKDDPLRPDDITATVYHALGLDPTYKRRPMHTRRLGNSDLHITPVGFGAWAIGGGGWAFGWGAQDDADSVAAIREALDLGINWIDTAAVYGLGHSEEVVAKALEGVRNRPHVFTKCARVWDENRQIGKSLKADSIRRECEASLRRLKVDVIDLYQVHWPEPEEDIEEGWRTMVKLREEGKVRWIGVSNFNAGQMARVSKAGPITSLQPPYSMLRRDVEGSILPYCLANDIGVIVYSPMQSGLLTGAWTRERLAALPADDWRKEKNRHFQEPLFSRNLRLVELLRQIGGRHGRTPGEVAIAWVLRHPAVTGAIVGARKLGQLKELVGAAEWRLTDDEAGEIERFLRDNPG